MSQQQESKCVSHPRFKPLLCSELSCLLTGAALCQKQQMLLPLNTKVRPPFNQSDLVFCIVHFRLIYFAFWKHGMERGHKASTNEVCRNGELELVKLR